MHALDYYADNADRVMGIVIQNIPGIIKGSDMVEDKRNVRLAITMMQWLPLLIAKKEHFDSRSNSVVIVDSPELSKEENIMLSTLLSFNLTDEGLKFLFIKNISDRERFRIISLYICNGLAVDDVRGISSCKAVLSRLNFTFSGDGAMKAEIARSMVFLNLMSCRTGEIPAMKEKEWNRDMEMSWSAAAERVAFQGDIEKALAIIACLNDYLKLKCLSVMVRFVDLKSQGNKDKVLSILSPISPAPHMKLSLAQMYIKLGESDKAIKLLDQIYAEHVNSFTLQSCMVVDGYLSLNMSEKAYRIIEDYLQNKDLKYEFPPAPHMPSLIHNDESLIIRKGIFQFRISAFLQKLGKADEARALREQALEIKNLSGDGKSYLFWSYLMILSENEEFDTIRGYLKDYDESLSSDSPCPQIDEIISRTLKSCITYKEYDLFLRLLTYLKDVEGRAAFIIYFANSYYLQIDTISPESNLKTIDVLSGCFNAKQ